MGASGHHHSELSTPTRLMVSAGLFLVSFIIQFIGSQRTESIALLSDSIENLNDVFALSIILAGLWIANSSKPTPEKPYGWHRIEVLNSLLVVALLTVFAGGVGYEAWYRFSNPAEINTGRVIGFSLVGLTLNVVATLVLAPPKSDDHVDLNLKSAYLHAMTDSLTSIALVGSMIIIQLTGWVWVDPLAALIILLVIIRSIVMLLKDVLGILLHRSAFSHADAIRDLKIMPGILGVEDLRSWHLCSHLAIATAHIIIDAKTLEETEPFLEDIEELLCGKYGVRHLTIQFETLGMSKAHHHEFIHAHGEGGVGDPIHRGTHQHQHPHRHP